MDETLHDSKYAPIPNVPHILGEGNFGQARLMREKKTGKSVAIKYIPRGKKLDENVVRYAREESFLERVVFSPGLFFYLSSVVVSLFAPWKCFMCRSNARGRRRETAFRNLMMMFVMFVMLLRRARAIHAMKRERFCISLYLVSFQRERMRFEFKMLCFFYVRSPFLLLLNSYLCLSVVIRFDVIVRTGRFLIHK